MASPWQSLDCDALRAVAAQSIAWVAVRMHRGGVDPKATNIIVAIEAPEDLARDVVRFVVETTQKVVPGHPLLCCTDTHSDDNVRQNATIAVPCHLDWGALLAALEARLTVRKDVADVARSVTPRIGLLSFRILALHTCVRVSVDARDALRAAKACGARKRARAE